MILETAYFIAKEELPISKFEKIYTLEVKHGVQNTSASVMIDFIVDSMAMDLKRTLENCKFFRLFINGSTDASITDY